MSKVSWIKRAGPGPLGIVSGPFSADRLSEQVETLKRQGVEELVSFQTHEEIQKMKLEGEADQANGNGIDFRRFPIKDHGCPPLNRESTAFFEAIEKRLKQGRSIAVHCNKGVGRSGLGAAAVLVLEGMEPDEALKVAGMGRGRKVPDNARRSEWVHAFAGQVRPFHRARPERSREFPWLRHMALVGAVALLGVAIARAAILKR